MKKDRQGYSSNLPSPLKVRGRGNGNDNGNRNPTSYNQAAISSSSSRQPRRSLKELIHNKNQYSGAETHHIIRFKPNKHNQPPSPEEKKGKGSIQKARQAIKNRMNKKKTLQVPPDAPRPSRSRNRSRSGSRSRSHSYSSNTKGIEATLAQTTSRRLKLGPSIDPSSSTRGRSIERTLSGVSQKLRRSLSMKRTISKVRSLSRGRPRNRDSNASVSSAKSGILEKVKSFRRQRSMSVRSVRSTRSRFSVKSHKSINIMSIGKKFSKFF